MFFVLLLGIAALVGLALTSAEVFLTYRLLRGNAKELASLPIGRPLPFISILKPLCGLEDGLEANLESFANLDGASHEVVLSIADPNDPAIVVVESVRRRFPEAPFLLVVGGGTLGRGANPKIERLAAAARRAQGDVLFRSDSNIRLSYRYIAQTVERLSDPTRGVA